MTPGGQFNAGECHPNHKLTEKDVYEILNHDFLDSVFYKRIQHNCGKFQDIVNETIKENIKLLNKIMP